MGPNPTPFFSACLLPIIRGDEGPITIRTRTLPHLLLQFNQSELPNFPWDPCEMCIFSIFTPETAETAAPGGMR